MPGIGVGASISAQFGGLLGGIVPPPLEGDSAALRTAILALAEPTATGSQATSYTLVTSTTLPAGMTFRPDIEVVYSGGTAQSYTGLDFRGLKVVVTGTDQTFTNCIFGSTTVPGQQLDGMNGYNLQIEDTAVDITFSYCTIDGAGPDGRSNAVVMSGYAPGPQNTLFHRCRWTDIGGDALKPSGTGTKLQECYFEKPRNVPTGTQVYDAGTTYLTNDHSLFLTAAGKYRLYQAIQNVPLGEEPTGTTFANDYWRCRDYHYDVTQVAGFKDMVYQDVLMDCRDGSELGGLPDAIGINSALMFSPLTNRRRLYDNLLISGLVLIDPFGGFNVSTFSTNIREWSPSLEYSTGNNGQLFCKIGLVTYLSLTTSNLGNDPATSPTEWVSVRDIDMPGPMFCEHVWIATGVGGTLRVFDVNTPAAGSSKLFSEQTGLPLAPIDYQVELDRPVPTFGVDRAPIAAPVVYGPASRYTIEPTVWSQVGLGGVFVSGHVVHIEGTPSALLFEDGTPPLIRDSTGITVTKSGAVYTVEIFNEAGLPMAAKLSTVYGTATVTSGTAVATSGPLWGFSDVVAPILSAESLTASGTTALNWSITTDTPDGTIYAVLLPNAAEAPSRDQIIAGTDGEENGAVAHVVQAVTVAGVISGTFTGLPEATSYAVYFTQVDVAGNRAASRTTTGITDSSAATFALTASGPYFRDPVNVPANTTRIKWSGRYLVPAGTTNRGVVQYMFTQESLGFDTRFDIRSTPVETTLYISSVETNDNISVTPAAPTTIARAPLDTWIDFEVYCDQIDAEVVAIFNGGFPQVMPFSGPSTGSFTAGREVSMFASTAGTSMMPAGVVFEYIECEFTTNGVTTLRKRIDASNVNTDPWRVSGAATIL